MNRFPDPLKSFPLLVVVGALILSACSGSETTPAPETTTTVAATSTTAEATTATLPETTTSSETPAETTRPPRTRGSRGAGAAQGGDPLPIPQAVDPVPATATRYGVIGCSNTDQAVRGYTEVSTKDLVFGGDLGGGTAAIWGNPSQRRYPDYWALFEERRPVEGYDGVWIQLCIRESEHGNVFDQTEVDWVTHIVEQVRLRDPGVTVWISPINTYVDGHVCDAIGAQGNEIASATADWAATHLDVLRGPNIGPLSPAEIGVRDNCHPNGSGEALLGGQLVEFFDAE